MIIIDECIGCLPHCITFRDTILVCKRLQHLLLLNGSRLIGKVGEGCAKKSTPPVLPYHSSHPFTQRYTHKSHAYIGCFSPPSMHIGYCRSCPQPTNQKCWHAVISAKAVTNNNFLAKKLLFTIWYTLAVVRYRDGGANPLERLWIDFWDPKPRVCFLHLGVTRVFIRCLGEGMATRRC